MNTCDRNVELGPFVLDAMEPEDRERVRAHLRVCDDCRAEHALLSELPGLLGHVDSADVDAAFEVDDPPAEQDYPAEHDYVVSLAAARVQRARRRRIMLAAAAAVAVLATGPVVAIALSGADSAAPPPYPDHVAAPPPAPDPAYATAVTDPATHVSLRYALENRKWGTHAVFELSGVGGAKRCKLVAVSKTGQRMDTATWLVPLPGYGVPGQPKPLQLHASIAVSLDQLAALEVETLEGERLVGAQV